MRLWLCARNRGHEKRLRDSRHAGLCCAGDCPVRAALAEDRHLVGRCANLRSSHRLQPIRRRRQAGNIPQHHTMQSDVSR